MNMLMFFSPFMAMGLYAASTKLSVLLMEILSKRWHRPLFSLGKLRERSRTGIIGAYLLMMLIFWLMFNVYIGYKAVYTPPHGSDALNEELVNYYPPPELRPLLVEKRMNETHKKAQEFCKKFIQVCEKRDDETIPQS
jgi:hypothetical protein